MLFSYSQHIKKTFGLALPVMIAQLGQMMVGVVDSLMVGQLGVYPLAAQSFGNSFFNIFFLACLGISIGMTPLIAQADGEKNFPRIALLLQNGLAVNLISGIVLLGLALFSLQFIDILGQDPEVENQAIPYIKVVVFSIIPFTFFQTFRQFSEGLSFTKEAMYITLAGNVVNIFFNYTLIFGNLGFPTLGLLGAGIGSLISRVFMAFAMAYFVFKFAEFKKYNLGFSRRRLLWKQMKKIWSLGIPIGAQITFEVGAFVMAAFMIGWISAPALAAHQIAMSLSAITFMFAMGLSSAATIRVGNQLGMKDLPNLERAAYSSYFLIFVIMSFFAVMMMIGNEFLPTLFIEDPEVVKIASSLLFIAALFQISDGWQVVGMGILRGLTDVKVPTGLTVIAYVLICIPLGYILAFHFDYGPEGVWYGLLLGLSVSAILLYLRFRYKFEKL